MKQKEEKEEEKEMISSQIAQTAEDAWIAKYRAALEIAAEPTPRLSFGEMVRNIFDRLDSRLRTVLARARKALERGLHRQSALRAVLHPRLHSLQSAQAATARNRIKPGPRQKGKKPPLRAA